MRLSSVGAPVVAVLLCAGIARAPAVDLRLAYLAGEKVRLTERADLRRYDDGRFVGLSYREVRGVFTASALDDASELDGEFYVFEETKHDTRLVAKRIDDVVPVSLRLAFDGSAVVESELDDPGHPSVRSFPILPAGPVETGASWQAFGVRVVEPFRDGKFTRVRFYCDYRYAGTELRDGREMAVIRAQYAVRYRAGDDPLGDERIRGANGRHVVTIYFDPVESRPVFMSDQMEEQFTLRDGKSLAFKGFILTWYDGIEPMDRVRLAEELVETLRGGGVEDVDVVQGERGVTLTVNRIHFVAERADILPEDRSRLEVIAEALVSIPRRTFLVIGHTARWGSVESQESLSVERAKAVVDELASRGIEAGRFIYEGRGAREPVAPNDTEDNMARNRRVEILILED